MPLAMAAGFFLDAVLIPSLQRGQGRDRIAAAAPAITTNPMRDVFGAKAPTLLLAFLFLYGTVMAYFAGARLVQDATLEPRDEAALAWISGNTSATDRFALVTEGEPLLDATSDWFPAITGRRSIASFFGAEWIPGLDFGLGLSRYRALQACADKQSQCIEDWMRSGTESADYVYVRARDAQAKTALQESLRLDGDFQMVYAAGGVELFEWVLRDAH